MSKDLIGRKVIIKDSGSDKRWKIAAFSGNNAILRDDNGQVPTPAIHHLSRLEVLPIVPTGPAGYLSTGGFRLTPDEATEWFTFLMLQASDMFTNMPDGEAIEEIKRLLIARGEPVDGPCVTAAIAYFNAANDWYEKDAAND